MKPLLVEGLTATREGHVLLEHLSFEIRSGEVTGIISDNPGHLNFLVNILGGIEKEERGRILYSGRPWSLRERLGGVGIAREQVCLVDSLPVLDNLFLSNHRLFTWFGFIQRRHRRGHARGVLRQLEVRVALDQTVQRIDPATKVLLDVARVLIKNAPYSIFQGVTRNLSLRQYEAFATTIRSLKASGRGVLLVPINAEDVRRLVDRLYYLQGTQLFELENADRLTDDQLHAFFLGSEKQRFLTGHDPVLQAKQALRDRCAEPEIDFNELAREVGMSYDNFRRRFKQQVGQSPHQYFLTVKLERAKELLLFTDLEIKDVARQLGFADPYYFSRFFKDRTHISPLPFRKGERE